MASSSAAATSESAPLLDPSHPRRPQRTVTFNPTISSSSPPHSFRHTPASSRQSTTQPLLSSLNSKLRRRNSQGSPLIPTSLQSAPGPKIGPQRTTRTAEKLKLLPDPAALSDGPDEESGRDVYAQFTRIKDPTARRDAARLGKEDRERLPRVTAYCTASSYRMAELMRWLKGKSRSRGANPKLFDECIYTPWRYERSEKPLSPVLEPPPGPLQEHRRYSDSELEVQGNTEQRREDLIDLRDRDVDGAAGSALRATLSETAVDPALLGPVNPDFDTEVHVPELFLFAYGTVVLWGLSLKEEHRFLREIEKFEEEKLAKDDVQIEDFNFYYTREYQARIYNDFISLRDKKAYMTKLAISHALAQSVKTSLHESLLATTIATSSSLPHLLSTTGTISLSRKQINQQIGHLFILRISIHLQGSVLDSPELMWAEPQLEPVYTAVRNYLEMDQRVRILGERLGVLGDLLEVMRGQLSSSHGEYLEWIVIVLIAAEILVAAVNIVVDLYAGVD
ncbi:sporulation protein rmd1 [Coniosporium apollinis]|uniref:Sporulation protein rmd1 n=1 Tax=Coniosporium apollinis TaxID=61459 RepID=A0ABQ9P2B5_9PEZI|nr:sporulation protein rmd1 [Coniosporium apollinis]